MKKILLVCSLISAFCSCTSSKDSTTTEKTEKQIAPIKSTAPVKDSRGYYTE